jgi:hypothetical protein
MSLCAACFQQAADSPETGEMRQAEEDLAEHIDRGRLS